MSNTDYELGAIKIRSRKFKPDNNEMNNYLGVQKD